MMLWDLSGEAVTFQGESIIVQKGTTAKTLYSWSEVIVDALSLMIQARPGEISVDMVGKRADLIEKLISKGPVTLTVDEQKLILDTVAQYYTNPQVYGQIRKILNNQGKPEVVEVKA